MTNELAEWLQNQAQKLLATTMYRAPNMLPDEQDVDEFLRLLVGNIGLPVEEQFTAVQTWALSAIGSDVFTAGDWLTIFRVLKEEISTGLIEQFAAEKVFNFWRELDYIFTNAIIEAAQLTSYMGQADLLEHTVQMREKLERLEESKSNFITVGAHELRTPLTIVEGYANMLRVELGSDSKLSLYLNGMENGLLRLQEIIGDMIDISLIDLQSFDLNYQKVNLEKMILLVADNLDKHFAKRKVELIIEPFDIEKRTYADPQKLVKAFEKILLNGLKYTPDGGKVVVTGGWVEEFSDFGDIAGFVEIQIRDTGIGIDSVNLDRIFDKFSSLSDAKLHSSSKTAFKGGGAGLGLPITKGIIEAHGGQIWAYSPGFDEEKCPGSVFHVRLPIYLNPPVSVDGM